MVHPKLNYQSYLCILHMLAYHSSCSYEGGLKSSSLAYKRRETRDKRLLGRDLDMSWCPLHTSLKLFWSRHMAPWTLAAAYECAAAQSMDPWAAIKKASQECGSDISSCPGPYPTAACPEFHVG